MTAKKAAPRKAAAKKAAPRKKQGQKVIAVTGHDLGFLVKHLHDLADEGWFVQQIVEGSVNGDAGWMVVLHG